MDRKVIENEVERDYSEMYDAIARRMFVIGTLSSMAQAELGCTWMSDKQKMKYITEEVDNIETTIDMIKDLLWNGR